MKHSLLFALIFLSALSLSAAPGDTTWVQAHNDKRLDQWAANFDSTVTFPDGSVSYRKIIMVFTLGKYVCGVTPCSDWDYTVQTKIMTPGGDTLELGRLITPYANSARMTANWRGVYNFDVTDYYHQLKNTATVRVHYSGYSGGFTANVKFAFIEGTRPRDVVGITPIWKNSFNYGHGPVAINNALANVNLTAPSGTVSAESKFTITGHGGDAQNCAEFCPNTYTMNLNNNQLVQQNFWRADCGFNNFYPQNGTWVYDRAGWCPGDLVHGYSHELTGITANSNYTLNVTFPPYTSNPSSNGSRASYIIESAVVYYAGFNKVLDASLDEVVNRSNAESLFRGNPSSGNPTVLVRNTGSTPITSIKFEYGLVGAPLDQYTSTNFTLGPLKEVLLVLPNTSALKGATGSNNVFIANILEVNGQADDDLTNNTLTSTFTAAPVWPTTVRISFNTNGSLVNGISETSWKIYDASDNIVAQRINNAPSTTYTDTVVLGNGSYRLVVDDAGCDGINWWAYQFYNPNPGIGSVQVRSMVPSNPLPMNGYFNGDFGCGFTQYFTSDWPAGVDNITGANTEPFIEAFPNPAQQSVTVSLAGVNKVTGTLNVVDALGRVVLSHQCAAPVEHLNTSRLANGMYTIVYTDNSGKLQTRLLIAK